MLGSGGHARAVLALAADLLDAKTVLHYISLEPEEAGPFSQLEFLGSASDLSHLYGTELLNGVGLSVEASKRQEMFENLIKLGLRATNLISKNAYVDSNVELGTGIQVFQKAIIQTGCVLRNNISVGVGAIIEHDSQVEEGTFVAPGAIVLGEVTLGRNSTLLAGAIVLPGKRIGEGAVVGAGSVVLSDVPPFSVYAGNPAKHIRDIA
jgi:sugar O-acyltransferase (sialic acid O-acetyltransferase NeuD family)